MKINLPNRLKFVMIPRRLRYFTHITSSTAKPSNVKHLSNSPKSKLISRNYSNYSYFFSSPSADAISESRRVNFKIDGVPKRVKAEVSYRKQEQIQHFKKILGRSQNYFTNSSFLSRGHMTPDADFIFTSGQFATYFYTNVCPQFQTINGGNWRRVEGLARQLAEQEQTKLDIYTGTYRQLTLPSADGDLVHLYMSDTNQIEVPEYVWKIVHNPRTHAAIVFITSNNPFARRSDIQELCPDVCRQSGIEFSQTARRGFTQCCSYDDFSRILSPHPLNVNRLLVLQQ